MFKKSISVVLALTMLCSFLGTLNVFAATNDAVFSDVNGHWAQSTIEELAGKGIIDGKGNGLFDPEGKVTRAEFVKLLMCVVGNDYPFYTGEFADVPEDAWFNPYVYAAFDNGIFYMNELTDNYFMPDSIADRETVTLWSVRLIGIIGEETTMPFTDNSLIENKTEIATAYNNGIVTGDPSGAFRPKDGLTRAEAATIIKRVIGKYAELHTLRPSKNMVDYKDGLNEVSATENVNVLADADEENGIYVFENINDEIRNLKVDDLFVIKPCEAVPSGIAIKVKDISISGNRATIIQGDISLDEIIDEIDVAQETQITMDDIVPGSIGEGVTIVYDGEDITNNYLADASDKLLAEENSHKLPLDLKFEIDYSLNKNVKLEGSLSLSDLVITSDIDVKGLDVRKVRLTETHKTEIDVKLSGSAKYDALSSEGFMGRHIVRDKDGNPVKDDEGNTVSTANRYEKDSFNEGQYTSGTKKSRTELQKEIYDQWKNINIADLIKEDDGKASTYNTIKLASFNFPIGTTGIFGTVDFNFTMEGKIEASGTFSFSDVKTTGIDYTKENGLSKVSESHDVTNNLVIAGEGGVKVGAEARFGVTFLYVITLDVGIGAGIGAKVSTEVELFDVALTTSNTNVVPGRYVLAKIYNTLNTDVRGQQVQKDEVHSCDLCFDGRIYLYLTIDAKCTVGRGMFSFTLFNPKWEILDDSNARLLSAYLSVNFSRENILELGWGRCPHYYKKPTIYDQTEDKELKLGDSLNLEVVCKKKMFDSVDLTWDKTVLSYQWYKDDLPIDGADKEIYQIGSVKESDAGKYTCLIAIQDEPSLFVLSKDIDVKISQNTLTGGTTKSDTAKSTGHSGSVSESEPISTFTYTAPVTGMYYFANGGNHKVFINVDGNYKINEGNFELDAGQTYAVNIEWYLEDTDYLINIFAPNSAENITGNVSVTGTFAFVGEAKSYKYTADGDGEYTFTSDSITDIKIVDESGNVIGEGNPHVTVALSDGSTYNIILTTSGTANKSFNLNITRDR